MNKAIAEIIAYVEAGTVGECLENPERTLGQANLRLAAIELLGWLRIRPASQHFEHGLFMGSDKRWRRYVEFIVAETPLRDLLTISNQELRFRDHVTPEERSAIREYVRREHQPRVMK